MGEGRVNGPARARLVDDVGALARGTLAPLDAEARAAALDFLASTLRLVPTAEHDELSEKLFGIREALRERLPLVADSADDRPAIQLDRIMAVDERSFYVEGSLGDVELARLTAVSPEGSRCELLDRLFRNGPSDGEDSDGFVCFFALEVPSLRADGWVLELETTRRIPGEVEAPTVVEDPRDVRDTILNNPSIAAVPDDELMSAHVVPAIKRVQTRIGSEPEVASVTTFGEPPKRADISIVVPLYLQVEHIEVQLAQFADDPDFLETDLIYVLDSPQQAEELLTYAADLHPIYRIPFRVAVLNRNAGFAAANNAGAALASGRLLLLLNSDVLPERPGWLSKMRAFYDATPNIGAAGAKLLYEDDSIQHAGMFFHRLAGSPKWVDGHYFKGMHRSLPAAAEARVVPYVSGSCLMIDRSSYQELGGLNTAYVQGDYEDAELCLRLWKTGRENWYFPEAELYHLEGQSYGSAIRASANRYNMWLHNHLWGEQISALMADPRFAA
jgi:GT2 family glycosyltransferase